MEEEEERRKGTGGATGREDKARGQDDTLLRSLLYCEKHF